MEERKSRELKLKKCGTMAGKKTPGTTTAGKKTVGGGEKEAKALKKALAKAQKHFGSQLTEAGTKVVCMACREGCLHRVTTRKNTSQHLKRGCGCHASYFGGHFFHFPTSQSWTDFGDTSGPRCHFHTRAKVDGPVEPTSKRVVAEKVFERLWNAKEPQLRPWLSVRDVGGEESRVTPQKVTVKAKAVEPKRPRKREVKAARKVEAVREKDFGDFAEKKRWATAARLSTVGKEETFAGKLWLTQQSVVSWMTSFLSEHKRTKHQ